MKIVFPSALDPIPVDPDVTAHNAGTHNSGLSINDLPYMILAIEKKLGCDNSDDTTSVDNRIGVLEGLISQLSSLTTQLSTLTALTEAIRGRSKTTAVLEAGTDIYFEHPMPDTVGGNYIIIGSCFDASGGLQAFTLSAQTKDGFHISPIYDGTFQWIAIPNY